MNPASTCQNDRLKLRAAFYQSYDAGRCQQLLASSNIQLNQQLELLGEGAHFIAWRLPRRSPDATLHNAHAAALSLVIKRPTAGFVKAGSPRRRAWMEALTLLTRLPRDEAALLIPPMVWVESPLGAGLVMPYGEAPLTAAAQHWQPLSIALGETHAALARLGLRLMDVDQGRSWQGIPFLIDYSDLERA